MSTAAIPATAPEPGAGLVAAIAEDDVYTAKELVEILAHCRSLTASADYRMLQAANFIHQQREEEYLTEVAEVHSGEVSDVSDFAELAEAARFGGRARTEFGPDGLARAVAEVGAVLNMSPARAREVIMAGSALRNRLSLTGHALATGRIDLATFLHAVSRTRLCTPEAICDIDAHLAQAIFARPPMARARFTAMADSIVAKFDPDALLRRRERAEADRNVSVRPDRNAPGQGRISASLPIVSAAEIDAALTSMAASVHRDDPRTTSQRRADALVAMSRGHRHLACLCPDCTAPIAVDDNDTVEPPIHDSDTEDAPAGTHADTDTHSDTGTHTDTDTSAPTAPTPCACPPARPTFHIVVNLTTLLGFDDDPGHLDGHGIIDADTMRKLLADANREFVRPQPPAPDATGYTPSRKLQTLIRAGELCCTFPGCGAPVWHTDIDHTDPFDHRSPGDGGQTEKSNLKPLCRFHHRIKTFTGWRDTQDTMGTVFFQSPTGHMFLGNAFTGTDLFTALRPPPDTPDPTREPLEALRKRQRDAHRRLFSDVIDAEPTF